MPLPQITITTNGVRTWHIDNLNIVISLFHGKPKFLKGFNKKIFIEMECLIVNEKSV